MIREPERVLKVLTAMANRNTHRFATAQKRSMTVPQTTMGHEYSGTPRATQAMRTPTKSAADGWPNRQSERRARLMSDSLLGVALGRYRPGPSASERRHAEGCS